MLEGRRQLSLPVVGTCLPVLVAGSHCMAAGSDPHCILALQAVSAPPPALLNPCQSCQKDSGEAEELTAPFRFFQIIKIITLTVQWQLPGMYLTSSSCIRIRTSSRLAIWCVQVAKYASVVAPWKDSYAHVGTSQRLEKINVEFVENVHAAGLQLHAWVFRDEARWVPVDCKFLLDWSRCFCHSTWALAEEACVPA